jgi:hypothetical protein
MMDQMDYYVEHVVDMHVRRPDGFTEEIVVRKEELIGTRHNNYYFFHTSHGRLEVPTKALFTGRLADGYYLAVRWSWDYFGRAQAETLFRRPREHNVLEMAKASSCCAWFRTFHHQLETYTYAQTVNTTCLDFSESMSTDLTDARRCSRTWLCLGTGLWRTTLATSPCSRLVSDPRAHTRPRCCRS